MAAGLAAGIGRRRRIGVTARVMTVGEPAALASLRSQERAVSAPGPGEVLVAVRACSLNYHDYLLVTGKLGPRPGLVPMSDGAGEVVAVGEGVTDLAPGDRVMSLFFPGWQAGVLDRAKRALVAGDSDDGYAATYLVRPSNWFTPMPRGLNFEQAATLPCAALTAWRALRVEARVKPGDWVLVQGTGGVSLFALQFAKLAGAQVVATSSSDAKLERLAALGADALINYSTTPDWGRQAARLAGQGVDAVVEVGGAGTLNQSIEAVRIGGHISLIGVLAGSTGPVETARLMATNATVKGVTVGSAADQRDMTAAIEAGRLGPVIDRAFPLEELADAFRHQASGVQFGKIVVTVADRDHPFAE